MNFEIAQDPRYVKFGLIVDKKVVLHTLRVRYIIYLAIDSTNIYHFSWGV